MNDEYGIFDKIIKFSKRDKNIKAAILNGSRANPNVFEDFLRDYDIALYVESLEESLQYKFNQAWISEFGNLVILQQNNFEDNACIFLLQYDNGLRIDLSFYDIASIKTHIMRDSLSVLLYDKDNKIDNLPISNERTYFVQKPTKQKWDETLNELWWLQPCIAKELWRDELPLAKKLYDVLMMNCLRDLLSWHIAIDKNWSVNIGHGGKWFKNLLTPERYNRYIYLYSSADKDEQWQKLLNIGDFIRLIAQPLSLKLGFDYPLNNDVSVSKYIRKIYQLPSNALSL